MLAIFFLLLFTIGFALAGWYRTAMGLYFVNLIVGVFVLWQHMTDTLKINW